MLFGWLAGWLVGLVAMKILNTKLISAQEDLWQLWLGSLPEKDIIINVKEQVHARAEKEWVILMG